MLNYKTWFLLICGLLLASCAPKLDYQDLSGNVKHQTLVFPQGVYSSLIWFKDDGLVAFLGFDAGDPAKLATRNDYGRTRNPYSVEGDLKIHDFQFKLADNCGSENKFIDPMSLLPDGRLGLLMECNESFTNDTLSMFAYKWDTKESEKILNYNMPNTRRSGCFSWNPQMTRAIQGTYDGTDGSLYWLTLQGPEPLQLILTDGNKSWDLSKSYTSNGETSDGIAKCAQWSPDGEHIFFMASLDPIGVDGFARFDAYYNLYSYSVSTGKAEKLLLHIFSPGALHLSSDGQKMAFKFANPNDSGSSLWIFRLKDKKLFRITSPESFGDIEWSPDSKDIAVVWCSDAGCDDTVEIRKYSFELPDFK
jgi:Tol biopolymer transport system component